MDKTALVLAGGGSRGAYEIGVWRALRELDEPISIITGTSVGALNAAAIAMDNDDRTEQLWKEIYTSRIFDIQVDHSLPEKQQLYQTLKAYGKAVKTGGAGTQGLTSLLSGYIDEEIVRQSPYKIGIVTLEVPSMKPHHLWLEDIPNGKLIDYLVASSALFPAVHPKKIDDKVFIDGGYIDNFPLEMALEKGARQIISVGLSPHDQEKIKHFKGCPVRAIYSYRNLGMQLLFDPETAKTNMRYGYLDTMRSFGIYDGHLYAFCKGSIEKTVNRYYGDIFHLFSAVGIENSSGKILPSAAYTLLKHRINKHGYSSGLQGFAASGMESAAQILDIPDRIIYTPGRFNSRLISAYQKVALPPKLMHMRSLHTVKAALKLAESPVRLKAICQLITYAQNSQKRINLLPIAAIAPEEFLAAIYMTFILE